MNVQYGSRAFCLGNMGLRRLRVRQISMGFGLNDLATAFMKNSS